MQQYMIETKQISDVKIFLTKDDFHHIFRVMRNKTNDLIVCADYLTRKKYLAKIIEGVEFVEIVEEYHENNELANELVLAFGMVKADKLELVIQKAAELGVSKFIPIDMEYSIAKIEEKKLTKKLERWHKISKEACEQARRNTIMEVLSPMSLSELKNINVDLKMVAYEKATLQDKIRKIYQGNSSVMIVVGPEGGISEKEINLLINNDFKVISLGKRILRCESAAIATTSIISDLME